MLRNSRAFSSYQVNSNSRRMASVLILLFEVGVATLAYGYDFMKGRNRTDRPFDEFFDAFYVSMMTFSTVGYGDMAPMTSWGQAFSPLMMQAGTAAFTVAKNRVRTEIEQPSTDDFGKTKYEYPAPLQLMDGLKKWMQSCTDISLMPKAMNDFWADRPEVTIQDLVDKGKEAVSSAVKNLMIKARPH